MSDDAPWAALALWAGRHGLALYGGLLGALLLATGFTSRWLAPPGPPAQPACGPGGRAGAPVVGRGLAAFSLAAGLFASIAWQLQASGALAAADGLFLQALSTQVSPGVHRLFGGLTHAADTATLTGLAVAGAGALWARRQPALAAGWALAIAGNGCLNTLLKQAFGRLRPAPLEGYLIEPGLSFPSGHSSGAVVACGMAAYLARRLLAPRWHLPVLLLAVALAFSIGASRVVLRVHFASDVLAGFASGSAWLALCITGLALIGPARRARSPQGADPAQ